MNPGAVVVTDGWSSYPEAIGNDYVHVPHVVSRSGDPAHVALPGVHRVASLLKRWLLGTHQGAVEADPLQAYLDEFAFRFNRRKAEFRGLLFRRLLEQAVQVKPVPYKKLVMNPAAKLAKPLPPINHQPHAPSFAREGPPYPWRAYNP